jgi:hypothetical protein
MKTVEVKTEIRKWFDKFRPDIELNDEFVDILYQQAIEQIIEDQFNDFETEEDIIKAEQGSALSHIRSVLALQYAKSIFAYVDSVFELEFENDYEKRKELGILSNELVGITRHLESLDITIDRIIDEPLSVSEKIEAEDEGIKYYTEEQLRKIINLEIAKRLAE